MEVGVNTDLCGATIENELNCLKTKTQDLEQQLEDLKLNLDKQKFCLKNLRSGDSKVAFYTGFLPHASLQACYNFLGPAVSRLSHTPQTAADKKGSVANLEVFCQKMNFPRTCKDSSWFNRAGSSLSLWSFSEYRFQNNYYMDQFLYLQLKQIPLCGHLVTWCRPLCPNI